MRRFLSITLLLMLSLSTLAPLMAQGAGSGAHRALCCRKDGLHHCMQAMPMDGAPQWAAPNRCPMCPRALVPGHAERVGVLAAAMVFGEVVAHPSVRRQVEARARMALDRARRKRGPPTSLLA